MNIVVEFKFDRCMVQTQRLEILLALRAKKPIFENPVNALSRRNKDLLRNSAGIFGVTSLGQTRGCQSQ